MTNRPEFHPTAEGYEDAMRRRRRRRQRRWATTATALGATGVIAVLLLPAGGPGSTSLRMVPPAATDRPTPSATATTPGPSGRPPSGASDATPPAEVSTTPAPTAVPGATHLYEGTPAATPPPPPVANLMISTATQHSIRAYAGPLCTDTSGRSASGWCVVVPADGALHGTSGVRRPLRVRLCHFAGLDNRVEFADSLETDFWITTQSSNRTTPWRYSHQHPASGAPRGYTVPVGSCVEWSAGWWVLGDGGEVLPSGSYDLHVAVNAENISGPNSLLVQTYEFIID